ncbi:hypothetical protein LTR56_011843 [Elasticomyces elasticus]|nr:hypothetical protein LTR56_011843 [Elasticomyces elasticus]KAK3666429.1 hypothetical protein LTR22_002734 [Elasticomyces elasticus]KAK4931248.1 hypothetical protein LTR49_002306 [Elasticomyces elasticus]
MTSPRFSLGSEPPTPSSPSSIRSGYPFPPTTTNSNRYNPRRGSNASTTSIDTRRGSTARETSQNAISNLLQPALARTGLVPHNTVPAGYKAPTTKDIPPVTLTNIPHVSDDSFNNYLQRIGPLFESFQRGRREPVEEQGSPAWLKKDRELEKTDRFAEALERRWSSTGPVSPGLTRQNTLLSPTPETPASAGPKRRRRSRHEPTPLSTIPSVYMDADFHLENPRTFDVVSENTSLLRPTPGSPEELAASKKSTTTNAILQEKLSWYMDTVEIHLITSISSASTGFFAALGSLKSLQQEAEESVARIQGLRQELRDLDRDVAVRGLEVAAKRRKRANVGKLAKAARQVERVVEEVREAERLVEEGGYEDAAGQMERVGRLICGQGEEGEGLIDLRRLKALQGLDGGLQDLQFRIGAGFAERFTNVLIEDLRQHVQRVPSAETLKRWSRVRGVPPTYMETTPQLRQDLLAALKGLGRAEYTAQATAGYREAVLREMKALIRRHLPSSTDEDADSSISTATSTRGGGKMSQQEKSSVLARNLRAMDPQDAEALLVNIYTAVGEALRRVSTQTKVLLDVTSSMAPSPGSPPKSPSLRPGSPTIGPPRSPRLGSLDDQISGNAQALDLSQALDMSSLLPLAVDAAQGQITKVLKVRNEQTVRLCTERFLRYFTLNRLFADECEAVSGQGGLVLRGVINAQISGFVQTLGQAEAERVAGLLDGDDWNARDFGEGDEVLLQRVLGSMGKDPVEWAAVVRPVWEGVGQEPEMKGVNGGLGVNGVGNTNGGPVTPGRAATVKPAYIDEHRYILVRSAAALLTTFDTFLALTSYFPSVTPTISTALLDVLRVFNSRSSQLILGAGATRVAGLKNITTKHLALASQALSFVVALIPYVRECVRRHLQAGSLGVLAEFDKTKRTFQEHQGSISDKLVEIMTSRSATHVRAMLAADLGVDDGGVSPYMETLTKETLTLHRVLGRHLSEFDVGLVMRRIFDSYREQWSEGFRQVEMGAGDAAAKAVIGKRLVRDAEAFEARLGKIEGVGEVGREVLGVVRTKVQSS